MKNLLLIVIVAILSSLATVYIHERLDDDDSKPSIIVREQVPMQPAKYANFANTANTSPKTGNRATAAPTDFIKGAARATPAVVHIRALQTRHSTPLFDDFWGRSRELLVQTLLQILP